MSYVDKFTSAGQQQPKKTHIFIDLDGVVADFDAHIEATGKRDAQGRNKWNELDYDWWAKMPPAPGAREFFNEAKKLGEVRFLTAPVLSEDCFAGKAAWVRKFVPEEGKSALKRLIMASSKDKYYLAGPDRILIDDRLENVEAWIKAGGIGIHHTGDFSVTMKLLREAICGKPGPGRIRTQGGPVR